MVGDVIIDAAPTREFTPQPVPPTPAIRVDRTVVSAAEILRCIAWTEFRRERGGARLQLTVAIEKSPSVIGAGQTGTTRCC